MNTMNVLAKPADGKPFSPLFSAVSWDFPEAIDPKEWRDARLTPDCIVQDYLYADVGVLVAPGGTGKTTIILFEAVHIVLGLPLWGLEVKKPGPVLFITAEDSREMLVARLRSIVHEMGLTEEQVATVQRDIRISDVTGESYRLTSIIDDVVQTNEFVDQIIRASYGMSPVLVVIDPAVSFGVGENRINDAEQGLIVAARKVRKALNCCVRYLHHSGKANGRDKTLDQYSGRGGSALPDGARMVAVMQRFDENEWRNATGKTLEEGESGLIIARPKLSYAAPQKELHVVRRGYLFDLVRVLPIDPMANLQAIANQLWQLLVEEGRKGQFHTKNTLESLARAVNLKRQEIRDGIQYLFASRRVEEKPLPTKDGRGGAHKFLAPIITGASPEECCGAVPDAA